MNLIPAPLRAMFVSRSDDGIYVTGRDNGFLTLERRVGASTEMRAVPISAGVRVTCNLDGQRSALSVAFEDQSSWTFEPGSEQPCRENYRSLMKAVSKKPRPLWHFGLAAAATLLVLFILVPSEAPVSAQGAGMPDALAGVPPSIFENSPSTKSSVLDMAELAQVKGAKGIEMKASGKPFYVFSDPNCPFCAELERSLMKVDDSMQPVVLPLGFKPGSRDLSAAVLCSENPAEAWRQALVEGIAPKAQACEKGLKMVDDNMALFRSLQMSSTPTMISSSGLVVVGSGDPEKIKMVMAQ